MFNSVSFHAQFPQQNHFVQILCLFRDGYLLFSKFGAVTNLQTSLTPWPTIVGLSFLFSLFDSRIKLNQDSFEKMKILVYSYLTRGALVTPVSSARIGVTQAP